MSVRGQFIRPALWSVGVGPERLYSISHAEEVVAEWLEQTPERPAYAEERHRILTLRQILRNSGPDPSEADLQSAKLAIKGFVRFARLMEGRRHAAYSSQRVALRPRP